MNSPPALLTLNSIRFGYPKAAVFLGPISLRIERGQFWGVVGPNGAGKSTLIRLMAGMLSPSEGGCFFQDRSMPAIGLRDRARKIAFLPQRITDPSEFAVQEVVLMGRYPHRSLGIFESPEDHRIAEESMRLTRVLEFSDRPLASLSGGEGQRAHLASVLAQEPELLLLDEPTAFLDLKFEMEVLEILDRLRSSKERAVVAVLHDVNLAAMFCSHVLLLHQGKQVACGTPKEVLTPQRLREVYDVELDIALAPGTSARWLIPIRSQR